MAKTPQYVLDQFPQGFEPHKAAIDEALTTTDARRLFAQAVASMRWAHAFESMYEFARTFELLDRCARELCSCPRFAEMCGMQFAVPFLKKSLLKQLWPNDDPQINIFVWSASTDPTQPRITGWQNGVPSIEGRLDPSDTDFIRYLQWAGKKIRGEPTTSAGRPLGSVRAHPEFPRLHVRGLRRIWDEGKHDVPSQEDLAEAIGISVDTLSRRFIEFPTLWPPRWPPRTHKN